MILEKSRKCNQEECGYCFASSCNGLKCWYKPSLKQNSPKDSLPEIVEPGQPCRYKLLPLKDLTGLIEKRKRKDKSIRDSLWLDQTSRNSGSVHKFMQYLLRINQPLYPYIRSH